MEHYTSHSSEEVNLMRKKTATGIIIALILLIIPCYAVYADLNIPDPDTGLKSYGNIIYEDENGTVQLYAEDIAFLHEEIMSIPEDIFDAGIYSHVHDWKYIDVNERTHTTPVKNAAACIISRTNINRLNQKIAVWNTKPESMMDICVHVSVVTHGR